MFGSLRKRSREVDNPLTRKEWHPVSFGWDQDITLRNSSSPWFPESWLSGKWLSFHLDFSGKQSIKASAHSMHFVSIWSFQLILHTFNLPALFTSLVPYFVPRPTSHSTSPLSSRIAWPLAAPHCVTLLHVSCFIYGVSAFRTALSP